MGKETSDPTADDSALARPPGASELDPFLQQIARAPALAVDPPKLGGERYRLIRRIGSGGMGAVYEAEDRVRQERVALKTLSGVVSPPALLRFKREFRTAAELHHTNLLRLHDLEAGGPAPFFTMELIDGADLATHLGSERRAPIDRTREPACELARLFDALGQILDGLEYLHARGIVHRDLKPANVLVTRDGRVKLLDFGIARELDREGPATAAIGTAAYMAPEQAAGRTLTAAADLYSLGCVLFRLLAGEEPFSGTAARVLLLHQTATPPRLGSLVEVPKPLDEIVERLLWKSPTKRPTIADIRTALALERREPASTARPRDVFVGRADLLAVLERRLDSAKGGKLEVVLIRGESGIGKTSLLGALVDRALDRGFNVLEGRCYEREEIPFRAFDRAIDQLSDQIAALPKSARSELSPLIKDASAIFPVLGANARGIDPTEDARALRRRAFAAAIELLARFAARRPLLLALDDLQWVDPDSVALLGELLAAAPRAVMVLGLLRPVAPDHPICGPIARARSDSTGRVDALELELGPFGAQEIRELLDRSSDRSWSDADLRGIAEQTGGHPLFVSVAAEARTKGPDRSEPLDLAVLLSERLAGLGPAARRVVELAAAAGGAAPAEWILRASELEPPAFFRELDRLVLERLLRRAHELKDAEHSAIDVYHDRIRQAALAELEDVTERELHRRLALALEGGRGDDETRVDRLRRHWRSAQDETRARRYTLAAADLAARKLAFDRATQLYAQALETHDASAGGVETAHVLERLATVRELAGDYPGSAAALERASRLLLDRSAPETGDAALRIERDLAGKLVRIGRADEGRRLFLRVLSALGGPIDEGFGRLRFRLAALFAAATLGRAIPPWLRRAPIQRERERLEVLEAMYESFLPVQPLSAFECQLRFLGLSLRLHDPVARFFEGLFRVVDLYLIGSEQALGHALAVLERLRAIADADPSPRPRRFVEGFLAVSELGLGRFAEARARLEVLRKEVNEAGELHRWESIFFNSVLTIACYYHGDDARAVELAEVHLGRGPADLPNLTAGAMVVVPSKTRRGAIEESAAALAEWERHVGSSRLIMLQCYLEIFGNYLDAARGAGAELVARTWKRRSTYAREGCLRGAWMRPIWWLPSVEATAAMIGDRTIDAITLWRAEREARWAARSGAVPFRSLGWRALAVFAAARGRRARAIELVRRAVERSATVAAPYSRWLCLEAASRLGASDAAMDAEALAIVTKHGFDPKLRCPF